MSEQTIVCPKCKHAFPLTKAILAPFEEKMRASIRSESEARQSQIRAQMQEAFERRLKEEKEDARKKAEQANANEILKMNKALDEQKRNAAEALEEAKRKIQRDLREQLKQELKTEATTEAKRLRRALEDKDRELEGLRKGEAELRKQQKSLEIEKRNLKETVDRRVEAKAEALQTELLSKDHKISELVAKIRDLKRRADKGSQEEQGTAVEVHLENLLKKLFPEDTVKRVGKGVRGADIVHKVNDQDGECCGTIIWESKNTAAWAKGWIAKIRADQRKAKAEVAVIATSSLPKGISHLGCVNGVWVTDLATVAGIAAALRANLLQVSALRQRRGNGEEAKALLYEYVVSTDFKLRVEAIVDSFRLMSSDLEKEKRVAQKNWKEREQQIGVIMANLGGMYFDMQERGKLSLPRVRGLLPD